jgi:hypothetical protein
MVTIRVPDLSALKTDAAKPQAPAQGEDKSAIQGKDKSKAQVKDKSKAGIAGADIKPETRIKWKDIAVRGFLASNGPTVLFVPPPSGIEKPPHIRWHNSRWDLEFRWFNAQTGEFLEQEVFQQVESLALTAPKAEAHVARVMVREHALHEPYTVSLPPELIKASPQMPWRASEWQLIVEAPVPPKQGAAGDHAQGANQQTPSYAPMHVPFVRTSRGYEASFNPNRQGVWSFHILHKGQKLGDLWQHPGKIQVVPSQQPAPLQRSQQAPRRLFAAGGPFFFFAQPIWDILSKTWSDGDFEQTLKQLGQQHTGASVIVAQLPELTWNRASVKGDIDANANTGTDADVGTDAADQATTRNAPSTRPKNEWDPALLAEIDRLEQRIAAIHKAGFHVALMVAPERWSRLLKEEGQERLFYLFDRLSSAYPVLWIIDYRNSEHKILPIIPALARDWFLRRHPQLRKALAQKQQNAQLQPTGYLPLVGAALGQPRSEERLKSASAFDFLWLDIDNLDKELRDFQLHKVAQPVVLTWQALLQDKSPFIPDSSQKKPTPAPVVPSSTVNDSQLLLWADFLWRSQLIGFMHTGRPITKPLVASKQTKAPIDIEPSLKAPAIMRAFFSTFDWSQLQPPSQSIQFQAHQAFAAETPANNQQQGHHIVAWINASVRQDLQIQRHKDAKLDEHRYLWLHPLTGEQPISPQLLPPTPKPDQAEKLQVPFQPAILYVFKRPPQQQQPQEQQRSKKSKQPDDLDSSQRQQIRNRLQQLQDNPLKPRKTKQRDRSGKRG